MLFNENHKTESDRNGVAMGAQAGLQLTADPLEVTANQRANSSALKDSKLASRLKLLFLIAMPVLLALYLWTSSPFRDELVRRVFDIAFLSSSQQYNVDLAARALDGRIIKPGELFSFNRTVGPRRAGRGYRRAPAYVGNMSPESLGGGICLVSSALYQAALSAGLKIEERYPHLRTIASVPPGLDATVWYGRQDLKFRNNSKNPLQIKAECRNHNLSISILGERCSDTPALAQLKTVVASKNKDEIMVEAFREVNGKRMFVSRDNYHINK